jgi:hypothetical protein
MRRFWLTFLAVLIECDVFVLRCVQWCVNFIVEWFSVEQRTQEKVLTSAYFFTMSLSVLLGHHRLVLSPLIVIYGSVAAMMRLQTSHTDQRRIADLFDFDLDYAFLRLFCTVFALTFVVADLFVYRHVTLIGYGQTAYTLHQFVAALPGGGQKGRRRKQATSDVKEWLATLTWLPEPSSSPS